MKKVKQYSIWQHRNGVVYEVIMFTNVDSTNEKYPHTVVYENIHNNKVYSRPLSDWHRSMTWVED